MLNRLEFLIGEAIVAFRRNGLMSFAAVSTVTVALFLLGGLGYVYMRVSAFAETVPSQLDIRVHLKDGTTFEQIKELAQNIRALPDVKEVQHIPKDKAWEKMKRDMPEETEGIENPLPDAFKIRLANLSAANSIRDQLKAMPHIDPAGIVYYEDAFNTIDEALRFIRWLGGLLGGLLFLTAGVLIHNAIRMAIIARRREIRIMQLVGATQATVGTPFLIEGMLHGIIGGALATMILWLAQTWLGYVVHSLYTLAKPVAFPVGMALFILCTAGALYGLVCSALAIREPLRLKS